MGGRRIPSLGVVRAKLREVATPDFSKFIKYLKQDFNVAVKSRHRRLLVISGSDPIKLAGITAQVLLHYLKFRVKLLNDEKVSILHVFHDEFSDAKLIVNIIKKVLKKFGVGYSYETLVYEVSEKVLGTTYQVLVMDLTHDLKPNDVGRLLGIVEGGGLVVLLTPPINEWVNAKTLFRMSLTVPQHPEPRYVFIKWFVRKLLEHKGIYIFDVDNGKLIKSGEYREESAASREELRIPDGSIFNRKLYELALTQDQVEVIKLIESNFVERVRRGKRVALIVTADRGRGKSCAVGIGIVGLINELSKYKNRVRVGVTAHEPLAIQSLMRLAIKALNTLGIEYRVIKKGDNVIEIKGSKFSIEYWQPLDIVKLNLDVVVVDEAAGIAVPLLHRIWLNFRRSIFSTTIHGYEGAGRGFSVRFLKRVKEDPNTKLIEYEMTEPIRYSINDPVERFQFDVLLLDAEPDEIGPDDIKLIEAQAYEYLKLKPEELFTEDGEQLLRSLFGIYVLAHYRNEPDDLGMLADAPHHTIRAIRLTSGKVIAAAQLAEEGPIPDEYVDELLMGGKIPGNIIPDRLLKHLRRRELGKGVGWRIVRIAVHPSLQGKGIGSFLLKKIIEEARMLGYDWVGSGFGVNRELLNFWLKNGFKVVHISPDRNPVSGEYTVLVIHPLNELWDRMVNEASKEFTLKLVESLHSVYRDLEVDTAYLLLTQAQHNLSDNLCINLTAAQIERLKVYVKGLMTFETVCDAVTLLAKKFIYSGNFRKLSEVDGMLLISKVLQGRSWHEISEELGISRVQLTNMVRKIVAKLLDDVYGVQPT